MRRSSFRQSVTGNESILDTGPDALIVIDERGIIQSFSTATARSLGYTSADVTHTAIANGGAKLHERLARWILMAHDRVSRDTLHLTHEFLSHAGCAAGR